MQNKERDKMIGSSTNKAEAREEEYFFSGGAEFVPVTVKAKSREEAEEKWKQVRVPVATEENNAKTNNETHDEKEK